MSKSKKKAAKRVISQHVEHGLSRSDSIEQNKIVSIGTERSYTQALSNYFGWGVLNNIHPDFLANRKVLVQYLEERSEWVKQSTLDLDRQALQFIYRQKLPYVRSQIASILEKRSYSEAQIQAITPHQNEKNSLTTLLALTSGLRAHEPATILPLEEQSPSKHRIWDSRLFLGFNDHQVYTVKGKGGLVRKVAIPLDLANRLEARRIPTTKVRDRGIYYEINYDLAFGQAFSQSFTSASKRAHGFSTGAHGLRHSFAKRRLFQLINALKSLYPKIKQELLIEEALLILSQELGHFRIDITFCYLR